MLCGRPRFRDGRGLVPGPASPHRTVRGGEAVPRIPRTRGPGFAIIQGAALKRAGGRRDECEHHSLFMGSGCRAAAWRLFVNPIARGPRSSTPAPCRTELHRGERDLHARVRSAPTLGSARRGVSGSLGAVGWPRRPASPRVSRMGPHEGEREADARVRSARGARVRSAGGLGFGRRIGTPPGAPSRGPNGPTTQGLQQSKEAQSRRRKAKGNGKSMGDFFLP